MKKHYLCQLFLIVAFSWFGNLSAQTVTGTVSDKTGPLPMVNVQVKGTNTSAQTDISGQYTILDAGPNAVLVFTYIGYATKEVAVNGQSVVNAVLAEDSQQLSEVVVTGYVSQQKRSISGAIGQVDMQNLEKTRVADVTQALQGQTAGVFVAASTGAPGDGILLRIRGLGTMNNSDVLYVVDGTPTYNIGFLNQADIKSISVLKDGAAATIYGSRAANGVVLITTKKGTMGSGKGTLDVEAFTGVHFATNLPKMLNADQYLTVKDQAWHNTAGNDPSAQSPYALDRQNNPLLADTDWQDALFTTGLSNSFQVSASGGTDKVQYLISGGYYGIDGIVVEKNDRYRRVNFRSNVNANLTDRFSTGANLQLSFIKQDKLSSAGDAPGVIRHALIRPPVIPIYKDPSDPTWSADDPYTDLPFYIGPDNYSRIYEYSSNPLAIVHFTNDKRENFSTFGNVYAQYAFLADKSLTFKSNLGADIKFLHNKNFAMNYGDQSEVLPADSPYFGLGRNNRPNSLNENRGQDVTFTWTNTFNYVKEINGKHSINALIGSEFIRNRASAIGGARSNFDLTSPQYQYLDYGGIGSSTTPYPYSSGNASQWALLSYFGSATYGYKQRYYATATLRADASSRFAENKKWGYFPAFSANWNVNNEEFLKNVNWISNLKVRASYAWTGNQEIPDNGFDTFVTVGPDGTEVIRYQSPNLQWESTQSFNVGVDLALIKGKLTFSADYFKRETSNIILPITLPAVSVGQIQPSLFNSAEVYNKGFEFSLGYQNNDHDFKYGFTGNLSTLKNEVTKLDARVPNLTSDTDHTRIEVGQPLFAYYGYQFIGIYQNQAEIDSYLYTNSNGRQPGDMKFRDINGDGQINAEDRTFIGSPLPKVTYGINLNASYKNFDISFLFQGVSGVDRYNDLKQILDYDTRPFNSTTAVLNSWNGEGTSNTRPRLTFNPNGGQEVSSAMVEDASYLRLKNLEIGYTFSKTALKMMNNMRIYISGQNLITWTKYTGLDPESTAYKDQGTYPQSTAVIFGARINL